MSGLSKEKSLQGKRFKNCDDVILLGVIVSIIKLLSFGEVGKDQDLYLGVEIRTSWTGLKISPVTESLHVSQYQIENSWSQRSRADNFCQEPLVDKVTWVKTRADQMHNEGRRGEALDEAVGNY